MKNYLKLFTLLFLTGFLAACAAPEPVTPVGANGDAEEVTEPTPEPPAADGFELVLVTDYGTIDDGSFNQGAWEGLVAYAQAHGITFTHIQPPEVSDAAYVASITLAVEGGARLIVTPGFLFQRAVYEAQDLFPDVKFVLLDTAPQNPETGEVRIGDNVVAVFYAEEQAGFLAGYAAVMEGYRSLGFVGGIAVPAVIRFGHGFVEGAEYAATQLGLAPGAVTVMYHYAGTFSPDPVVQTMAASWYADGVEVIFAAAGGLGFSIMAAAESEGGMVIGVDIDQAGDSETVLTSALKELSVSVETLIADFYAGTFPGGQQVMFDAANRGVGLPMHTSRFENFTVEQYEAIFARLAAGEIMVNSAIDIDVHGLNTSLVDITLIN